MGLDWCLNDKIRSDVPADLYPQVWAARQKDSDDRTPEDTGLLSQWLVSPMEHLGAKRLQLSDPVTMEAFRKVYDSHQPGLATHHNEHYREHWSRPFDIVAAEHEGNLLLNTIPDDTMIAHNKGNPFATLSGYGSFRGKRVQYCDLLPESLKDKAFTEMDPEAMREYADELEQYLDREKYKQYLGTYERYVALTDDTLWDRVPKADADKAEVERLRAELGDSDFYDHRTLAEATHWLRFWADAGFSMWPWY